MLNLLVSDTGIYLCSFNIRVTEHLTHAFHRYALAERHRRKGVSGKVEGKVLLDIAKVGYLLEIRVGLLIAQNGKEFAFTIGLVAIFGNDALGNIQ